VALPVPNLDDRRFQELVDDAKRLVQQRCPEWTDHNVSDPGVTLIEAFAFMTDQLLYRLNRVPDRNYVKFLELIGVRLFPPTGARVPVTFYLTAPQADVVRIAAGTIVATVRSATDESIAFTTLDELRIVPSAFGRLATGPDDAVSVDRTDQLQKAKAVEAFDAVPRPGNVFLVGLTGAVPSCAVSLRFRCSIEGVGVDPERPPLSWEAWTGEGWTACDVEHDTTGGLNRDGEVLLHCPDGHVTSLVNRERAGWLRARVLEPEPGVPAYAASPRIHGVAAATIGGTVRAMNAELITDEIVGVSSGVAGERFPIRHVPVVPGEGPALVSVAEGDGWTPWQQVDDFSASGPADRHFVLDAVSGEVLLGPAVREADGTLRHHGVVPAKGARVRLDSYLSGGGRRGNVAAGAIAVMRTSIPLVGRVTNRRPASGGVDGEDVDNAKVRGPLSLRTRGRAVTGEDYEQIVREVAPEVARVRAVPAGAGADAGGVRVLVVPAAADDDGRLRFEQLIPAEDTLGRISARLDECRVIGARVLVEPPVYQGITIVARLQPRPRVNPVRLQANALIALYRYFSALTGGPEGNGWPFGRPVQVGEVYAVLQAVTGTELVQDVRLFGADPVSGQRGQATQRLDLEPNALVFSYEHQLMVEGA
jgi:predicted phage baseplate assembly protein